jgi:very-short-patch-repair endonuclease
MTRSTVSPWWTPLEWHRRRRGQGVPTVTLLVGDADVAEWLWSSWQSASGARSRTIAVPAAREPNDTSRNAPARARILEEWLSGELVREALRQRFVSRAAARQHTSPEELRARISARSPGELAEFAEREALTLEIPAPIVAGIFQQASLAELVNQDFKHLAPIARLLGGALPPLLVQGSGAPREQLADTCAALVELVESATAAELALALGPDEYQALTANVPERISALLREGMLKIQPQPERAEAAQPESAPAATNHDIFYHPPDFARSQSERLLYRQLERRPRTQGRFALNCRLRELFGASPVEIDLVCESLRIAVEVDGYHHFRDSDAYRRDRRKDQLLQELGYVVVRVLATDVTEDIDYVLECIDKAVQHREQGGSA